MNQMNFNELFHGTSIPLFLAPMAGVTDETFRLICREHGADVCVTEMVSAKALYYKNKNTAELLYHRPPEHPIGVQIFGNEPELMAEQAALIEEDFDFVDVNMGCPVPKVVKNHEGSALMLDPDLAERIVSAMAEKLKKPVTVKFRKGFDDAHINAPEFAKRMEAAGAAAIAVHGRTREQYYSGQADWEIIRQVKEAVRIPVIGNGDIKSPQDAARMLAQTGCDGLMIARAARGNPWIFAQIRAYIYKEETPTAPDVVAVAEMILAHARGLMETRREDTAIRMMRKHIGWYTAGMKHSASIRRMSNTVSTYQELEELCRVLAG